MPTMAGLSANANAPGASRAARRGPSTAPLSHSGDRSTSPSAASASDSDESWISSPPETPTPSHHLSFPMKGRLVPFAQRLKAASSSSSSTYSSSSTAGSISTGISTSAVEMIFDRPVNPMTLGRRLAGPAYRRSRNSYRAHIATSADLTDTDTDPDSDSDGEIDQVRDTLIDISPEPEVDVDQRMLSASSDVAEDGDEVDSVLVPSEGDALMTPPRWMDKGKGKRRMSPMSEDGDDEVEGMLRVRDKGKRPAKMARFYSPSPSPDIDVKMAPSSESMYNVCESLNKLHAHSTIINMTVDDNAQRLSHPAAKRAQLKRSAMINSRQATRHLKTSQQKRGHTVCDHRRLTASADPYLALPIFQTLASPLLPALMEKAASLVDVSMADIGKRDSDSHSDAEDKASLSDVSMTSIPVTKAKLKVQPFRRPLVDLVQADVREIQLLRTHKIRACYEPSVPLTKVQLLALEADQSKPATGIHRRPRRSQYPERVISKSTSHLHRSSPSSLLPWWSPRYERNRRRQQKAQQLLLRSPKEMCSHKRHRPEFTGCISGQAYIMACAERKKAREHRRHAVKAYNERTNNGAWRGMIGNYWGYEQVSILASKWWLNPSSVDPPRDEVVVEHLLNDDAAMTSPSPAQVQPPKRKRTEREEVDEVLDVQVQDRRSRMDDLRAQQLEEYRCIVREQEAKEEQRRVEEEARQARAAEAVRIRAAEMAERRAAREARREADMVRELERIEAGRVAAEAAAAAAAEAEERRREMEEATRVLRQPSPVPSESSVQSEPPEYEFPFYPVIIPRPPHLAHLPSSRRPTRRTPSSPPCPPAYLPDRYTNRSPPPPPPYNARTDCQTIVAPIFLDDNEEDEDAAALPRAAARAASLEPEMVGAFPNPLPASRMTLHVHAPQPRAQPPIDPIRAFESALELEEGADDELEAEVLAMVDNAFGFGQEDDEHQEDDEGEEDVMPGTAVAGVFQRVFGLVWGGRR